MENCASSNSKGICEKIFDSIRGSSPYRTKNRNYHCPKMTSTNASNPSQPNPSPPETRHSKTKYDIISIPILPSSPGENEKSQDGEVAPKIEPISNTSQPGSVVVVRTLDQSRGQVEKVGSKVEAVDGKGEKNVVRKDEVTQVGGGTKYGRLDTNAKISSFIKREKVKIGSTSNVANETNLSRLETINHKVSDFLSKTKLKIRAGSNIGNGNRLSFK